jgi:RND family efflux transporter MFP subunit
MKKSVVIGGVVVVAAVALIAVRTFAPKKAAEEAPIPVVETEKLEPGSIHLYRDMVGTVEPSDVVYIYPKAAGEITEVFVKTGDVVEEGQPICTIDTKQVDAARLSMEAAKTALDNAQSTYDRQKALYDAGDVAAATFEGVETQLKASQIQYDQAKLAYDYQMEFANVTATIAGRIEKCDIEVHDNVASSVLLCVISGEGSKSVTFSVPEKIVKNLSEGDAVRMSKSGTEYTGTITEVSSMIDASTGLFKVKANVDAGDALPTGSTVTLYVTSDKADNVDTLSVDSIYYDGGDSYVYTYDNGTVHYIPVEVGVYDSERAQILSGIDKNTEVISTWSSELAEGATVQKAE